MAPILKAAGLAAGPKPVYADTPQAGLAKLIELYEKTRSFQHVPSVRRGPAHPRAVQHQHYRPRF
jgi:hypothetical protein